MNESLEQLLDKIAQDLKIDTSENQTWDNIPINYCFGKSQVITAVKIALEAKNGV